MFASCLLLGILFDPEMEAVCSFETSVNFTILGSVTSQKVALLVVTAVKTSTQLKMNDGIDYV
jgi:hypothetical protein